MLFVHIEYARCGTTDSGKTDGSNVGQAEMVVPHLQTRVEERYDVSRYRISTGKISALVGVTSVGGQRKICRIVIAAVLARNDTLNLEGGNGRYSCLSRQYSQRLSARRRISSRTAKSISDAMDS